MSYRNLYSLIVVLLILPGKAFSQKGKEKDVLQLPAECFYTRPDTSASFSTASLPFAAINLTDIRPDTTRLGYLYFENTGELSKICTPVSTGKLITSFLNNHFAANFTETGDTVFAYLKKARFSNEDIASTDIFLSLKIEFYLKKQSCLYALYRFDSTVALTGDPEKIPGTLLNKALIASVRKLFKTESFNFQNLQCLSAQQIDSFNYPLRNIPILRDLVINKGVYLSFKQFKNNKPAYTEFKISADEIFDVLYVNGKVLKDSSITDAWGFSDGEKIFIRKGNNFFPLHRTGDNFDFFAYDKIGGKRLFPFSPRSSFTDPATAAIDIGIRGLLSNIRSKSKKLELFQLDTETGRVH